MTKYATENKLKIHPLLRNVETNPPGRGGGKGSCSSYVHAVEEKFDVVVVANFLHRPTFANLINCLKPNGILCYQTFVQVWLEWPIIYNNEKYYHWLGLRALHTNLSFSLFQDKVDLMYGPKNPDFLLKKNELLHLCDKMDVLVYREEGTNGNVEQGWRNAAMIVAKKVEHK